MTTLTEFHYLPKLAPELQVMIWEAPMRDNVPGIHELFFDPHLAGSRRQNISNLTSAGVIFGHSDEKSREAWRTESSDGKVKAIIQSPRPRYSTDTNGLTGNSLHFPRSPLRRAANPPMYLHDGGLWTACRLSRWVMKKHHMMLPRQAHTQTFATDAPDSSRRSTALAKNAKPRDVAVYGHFPLETGERMPFHISSTDPMVIQADWESELAQTKRQPQAEEFSEGICQALENVNHFAVEWECLMFDELDIWGPDEMHIDAEGAILTLTWPPDEHERVTPRVLPRPVRLACQRTDHPGNEASLSKPRKLWFIDPSLERDPNWHPEALTVEEQNNPKRRRHVFHGTGMRFIEVKHIDKGWRVQGPEGAHRCDTQCRWRWGREGARCGIWTMADRIYSHPRSSWNITMEEFIELFESGPIGVLAV